MTAEFLQFSRKHVGQDCRCKSGGVGVDEEEQWLIAENFGTEFDQVVNTVLNFPDFTFWSSTVGRRVHDDGIVVISSADFTFYEFYAVVYQPADRGIAQSGSYGVFFCPGNHSFGCVYMGDRSTGCCGCESGTACIGKKIQYFYRASGVADLIAEPVPVGSLFREKSGMFEAERF